MLSKIIYRFKQFYHGMFSRYTKTDQAFARQHLNIEEMSLFNQLPSFEKKHSVIVARQMLALARLHSELDQRKLVCLGLLHDIGKLAEKNSLWTKSFLVIIRFFSPRLYNWLADRGADHRFWRRFYIHKHHGQVGAELLAKIGENSEILGVIAKHDPKTTPWAPDDPLELKLLQQADNTY